MKGTFNKILGILFSVFLIGGALAMLAAIFEITRNEGFEYPLMGISAATILYWIVLRGPLGKAVASLLEGEQAVDEMTQIRLEDVEDRVSELSLETQRVSQLEERLEFTERLLAQRSEQVAGRPDFVHRAAPGGKEGSRI